MVSRTFAILSVFALVGSTQAWLTKDFVRDVVQSSRRLDGHDKGGEAPDMAGCEKKCEGFMKMFMEVGTKLAGVDTEDPTKLLAAVKEHVCPRKADAEATCALSKCDAGTKNMLGSLMCMCDCGDKMKPMMVAGDNLKTEEDYKKVGCDKISSAVSCMKGSDVCAPMVAMQTADDKALMDKACPGSSETSLACPRALASSAGLVAMLTTAAVQAAEL